ncbi:type II toxin-antitoxin system VapC family toxin [Thioflexithrix psekupsensis]|uniref:PIN domain-containing protein n=1 Tax=Thioflexithrix psekupsensis TaxID=1570016 RepID=A0A251XB64_9GAMM|nr:type II toxin-antitoxin system VapC family toxin [Thioflexithrix psekupsensis]OUD15316.1 hypothetical protein TPSD3_01950 [Thioflexithrix psekupsensis]
MSEKILCDTCVLIDFFKGCNDEIIELNKKGIFLFINSIIELEILQGARNKREMQQLERKLQIFYRLDIPLENFQVARSLIKIYSLSHGLRLADALIAANALIYDLKLYTLNHKDFKFIPELVLYGK